MKKKATFFDAETYQRIWNALHMGGDSNLIERILCSTDVVDKSCDYCSRKTDSLKACLSSIHCNHKSAVDLIWGPPGTGKTNTLCRGSYLGSTRDWKMNCRTLVCAPTNVDIKEVASRVLSIVRESFDGNSDALFCNLGDMLLFGNHERLKVGAEIEEIYLDYRVKQLILCFSPPNNWKYLFGSMIDLLEICVSDYHIFIENEIRKELVQIDDNNSNGAIVDNPSNSGARMHKSFIEFVRERFLSIALRLRDCISILCTHISRSCIMEHNLKDLARLIYSLGSFQALLFENNISSEKLEELFSPPESQDSSFESVVVSVAEYSLHQSRTEYVSLLRTLKVSLGDLDLSDVVTEESIREFCFQTSSLIFSTASSSFKLHSDALFCNATEGDILTMRKTCQTSTLSISSIPCLETIYRLPNCVLIKRRRTVTPRIIYSYDYFTVDADEVQVALEIIEFPENSSIRTDTPLDSGFLIGNTCPYPVSIIRGLVFLLGRTSHRVGNPSLRSLSGVSQHPIIHDDPWTKYLMGYSSGLSCYKIIRLSREDGEITSIFAFTIGNDNHDGDDDWREVDFFDFWISDHPQMLNDGIQTLVDGSSIVHFICESDDDVWIISFNFLNEEVRGRFLPPDLQGVPCLCYLQDTLCCSNLFDNTFQIHRSIGDDDWMLWREIILPFNIPPAVFTKQFPICFHEEQLLLAFIGWSWILPRGVMVNFATGSVEVVNAYVLTNWFTAQTFQGSSEPLPY